MLKKLMVSAVAGILLLGASGGMADSRFDPATGSLTMDGMASGSKLYLTVAILLNADGTYSLQGEGFESVINIIPPAPESVPTFVSNTEDDTLQSMLDGTLTIPELILAGQLVNNCQVMFTPAGTFTTSSCTAPPPPPSPSDNCDDVPISPTFYLDIRPRILFKTEAEVDAIIGCVGTNDIPILGTFARTYLNTVSNRAIVVYFSSTGTSFDSLYVP